MKVFLEHPRLHQVYWILESSLMPYIHKFIKEIIFLIEIKRNNNKKQNKKIWSKNIFCLGTRRKTLLTVIVKTNKQQYIFESLASNGSVIHIGK